MWRIYSRIRLFHCLTVRVLDVSPPAGHAGERFHFFNLSSFGREERMIKAEFRWFRKKQKFYMGKSYGPHFYKVKALICISLCWVQMWSSCNMVTHVPQTVHLLYCPHRLDWWVWKWQWCVLIVQVDLYEVLDSRVKPWRGNLITSRLVPLYTQGWEVFNVTQTVMTQLFCFISHV